MPKSILVVDDSELGLAELAQQLGTSGYAPVCVAPAGDAVAEFATLKPELVFISLRRSDAVAVCEGIRDNADGAIVPILFTGTGQEAVRSPSEALAHGGDYYFQTPLTLPRVLAKVQTYVGPGDKPAVAPVPIAAPSPTTPGPSSPFEPEPSAEASPAAQGPTPFSDEPTPLEPWPIPSKETLEPPSDGFPTLPDLGPIEVAPAPEAVHAVARAADALLGELKAQEAEGAPSETFDAEPTSTPADEEQELTRAEEEARRQAESEAQRAAEEQARQRAEQEARQRAEEEARQKALEEARVRAEEESRLEAQRTAEEEARLRAEQQAQQRTEEARLQAEREAFERAQEEARLKAEQEAREKAEQELRRQAEEEARRQREEQIRREAEAEARRRLEAELRQKAEEEAQRRVEEELRRRAEEEARRKLEEELRRKAEEEARRKIEEELRREAEARRQLAEELNRRTQAQQSPLPAAAPPRAPLSPSTPGALSPAEGVFGPTRDIAQVVFDLWRQQVTGRVEFSSNNRQKTLVVERGGPVDAYSSQVFDRIEEYLYREGKITRTQYQEVRVKGLKGPRKVTAFLVNEGYLKASEQFEAVRGHLREVVLGLFEWEEGTYHYYPDRIEDEDRITLDADPRALVVEGIRRKYLMPRLAKRLGGPSSLVGPKPGASSDVEPLGLSAEERQVVKLLDGTRSIEDLVFSTGLEAVRVFQVLFSLLVLEYADVLVRGIEGPDGAGRMSSDDIDRQRIADKLEQARTLDYFQILGVSRNATVYEIERAYERARGELAVERFSHAVQIDLAEALQEILIVLDEAQDILRDQALRDSYAKHLPA